MACFFTPASSRALKRSWVRAAGAASLKSTATVVPRGGRIIMNPPPPMLPALGWALARGSRRLKALALALGAYFLLVALIPAWMPSNVRYFTVFFVCGGCTLAFLLPPWRMTRGRRRFLQVTAIALLAYAVGTIFTSL